MYVFTGSWRSFVFQACVSFLEKNNQKNGFIGKVSVEACGCTASGRDCSTINRLLIKRACALITLTACHWFMATLWKKYRLKVKIFCLGDDVETPRIISNFSQEFMHRFYRPWFLSIRGEVMSSMPCLPLLDFFAAPLVVGFQRQKRKKAFQAGHNYTFPIFFGKKPSYWKYNILFRLDAPNFLFSCKASIFQQIP